MRTAESGAVLRAELHGLVRTEGFRIAIYRLHVSVACQKERAVGHRLDRLGDAQRIVDRIGIGVKRGVELAQIEVACVFGRGHASLRYFI